MIESMLSNDEPAVTTLNSDARGASSSVTKMQFENRFDDFAETGFGVDVKTEFCGNSELEQAGVVSISSVKEKPSSEDSGIVTFDNESSAKLTELESIANSEVSNTVEEYLHEEGFVPESARNLKNLKTEGYLGDTMVKAQGAIPVYNSNITKSPDLTDFNFYADHGTTFEAAVPGNLYDSPDNLFDDAFSLDEFMLGNQQKAVGGYHNSARQWGQQAGHYTSTRVFTVDKEPDLLQTILAEDNHTSEQQPFINLGQQPSYHEIRSRTFSDLLRGDMAVHDGSSTQRNFAHCVDATRSRDYSVSSDSGVGSSILLDSSSSPSNQSSDRSSNEDEASPIERMNRDNAVRIQRHQIAKTQRYPSHVSDLSQKDTAEDLLADLSSEGGAIPVSDEKVSSKKTAYNEKWGVKVLKAWCVDMTINEDFEKLTPEQLNELLCRFWSEVRKSNGDYYGRNSLFNLRAMINKHLKGKPYCADFDIVTDERFRSSNDTLEKQLKILKGIGKTITHKQPISIADLRKMYDSNVLGTANPQALLRKVWFEITLHFCHKGSEPQEKLTRTSFNVFRDVNFRTYISRAQNAKSGNDTDEIRMYETGGELCPVRSYQAYLLKLHPLQSRLFQQPRRKSTPTSPMWYGKAPIGEKALQQMMANISVAAKLSKRYTNHCVRTTALEQFSTSRRKSNNKTPANKSKLQGQPYNLSKAVNRRNTSVPHMPQNDYPQQGYYKATPQQLTYSQQPHNSHYSSQYQTNSDVISYDNLNTENHHRAVPPSPIKSRMIDDTGVRGMSHCYKRTYEEANTSNHHYNQGNIQHANYANHQVKKPRLENCHVFLSSSRGGAQAADITHNYSTNTMLPQEYDTHGMMHGEMNPNMLLPLSPRKALSETIIAGDNIPEVKSITNQNYAILTNIV